MDDTNIKAGGIGEIFGRLQEVTDLVEHRQRLKNSLRITRYILPGENGSYIESLEFLDVGTKIKFDTDIYEVWQICPTITLRKNGDIIREVYLKPCN